MPVRPCPPGCPGMHFICGRVNTVVAFIARLVALINVIVASGCVLACGAMGLFTLNLMMIFISLSNASYPLDKEEVDSQIEDLTRCSYTGVMCLENEFDSWIPDAMMKLTNEIKDIVSWLLGPLVQGQEDPPAWSNTMRCFTFSIFTIVFVPVHAVVLPISFTLSHAEVASIHSNDLSEIEYGSNVAAKTFYPALLMSAFSFRLLCGSVNTIVFSIVMIPVLAVQHAVRLCAHFCFPGGWCSRGLED